MQTQFRWVLWLRFFHEAAIKMSARAAVTSRLNWGRICFEADSRGCWQESWAIGLQALGPCWLLAGDCLQFLAPWASPLCSSHGIWSPSEWASEQSQRECKNDRKVFVFCNLISEGTSHHFCCILFIRNKSRGPAHTQKERIIVQGHESQEVGIIGSPFRSCHHTLPWILNYLLT